MKNLIKLSFVGASLLVLGGCKKFVDVNQNYNDATSTRSQYVFSGAQGTTFRNQVSTNVHIIPGTWAGHYSHSTSFTGGGAEKTYEYTSADFNAFDGLFDNITDYQYVRMNADKDGVGFWKDPSNVMQCYVFQQLVDLYGNVPYRQAFQGQKNLTPAYDSAQFIYEDLIKRLDTAINNMKAATWPTAADIVQQDIYFQGNRTNWIRFANSLKLRILMRQSFIPGRDAYIVTNINSTIAEGYLAQNALVLGGTSGYQNIAGKLNPFYENFGYNNLNIVTSNHQYRKMNAVLVNWLKTSATTNAIVTTGNVAPTANADTFRLQNLVWPIGTSVITPSNTLSDYVGIPLGAGSGYGTASSSAIGPFMVQQGQGTRPGMLMLLAEVRFLMAEAAERYGIAFPGFSNAQALYESGVISHFRTLAGATSTANLGNAANAGDAFALRYLARPIDNVSYTTSTSKIRAILLQKWVSLVHINGLEAWSDYRKSTNTQNPSATLSTMSTPSIPRTVASTSNPQPVRYLYPQTEINANSANVPKNISRFTSRIFWDVN